MGILFIIFCISHEGKNLFYLHYICSHAYDNKADRYNLKLNLKPPCLSKNSNELDKGITPNHYTPIIILAAYPSITVTKTLSVCDTLFPHTCTNSTIEGILPNYFVSFFALIKI